MSSLWPAADALDWRPAFRAAIVNGALPFAAALGTFMGGMHALYAARRPPPPPPVETHGAAARVLATENAVIWQEAATTVAQSRAYAAAHDHQQRWLRADALLSLAAAAAHLVAAATVPHAHEWHAAWGLFLLYATALCYHAWRLGAPLYRTKLVLLAPYAVAMASNARSASLGAAGPAERGATYAEAGAAWLALVLFLLRRRALAPEPAFERLEQLAAPTERRADAAPADAIPTYHDEGTLPPPEAYASLLSRITYTFMTPFVWRQYWTPTTLAAIPQLLHEHRAASIVGHVRDTSRDDTEPLVRRLWRVLGSTVLQQLGLSALRCVVRFVPIFCLSHLLGFLSARDAALAAGDRPPPLHMGLLWAVAMFVFQVLEFVIDINTYQCGRRSSVQVRAYLTSEMISKVLRRKLHVEAPTADARTSSSPTSDGHIASLFSVDTFKFDSFLAFVHQPLVEYPITIAICCVYLYRLIGWSTVAGLSVLLVTAPLQTRLSKSMIAVQNRILKATDERLDLASEVLASIKTVKFFAWETPFYHRLVDTRTRELRALAWSNMINVFSNFLFAGMPMFVTLAAFGSYTYLFGHALTARTAFTSLSIFTMLRMPLADFPDMIVMLLNTAVSVRRLESFFQSKDTDKYVQLDATHDAPPAVPYLGFDHASFTFHANDVSPDAPPSFQLTDLTCQFPVGQLSLVVGPVGAGKSSLLHALLGELRQTAGKTIMPCPIARSFVAPDPATGLTESAAYCSQNAWLLGTTIRENILFGSAYDEDRYRAVLHACALEPDLDTLELHDETEVGEKGTSLSGGQKARVALARAFYSRAKHILIDDALSAVDAHTAEHLYEHCLRGPLAKGRTIVLVTHALALASPAAAYVVVMEAGRVVAQGAPSAVKQLEAFTLSKVERDASGPTVDSEEAAKQRDIAWAHAKERRSKKNNVVYAEKLQRESTAAHLSWAYIRAAAVRPAQAVGLWAALLALYGAVRLSDVAASSWVKEWAGAYEETAVVRYTQLFLASLRQPPSDSADMTWYYLVNYMWIVCLFVLLSTLRDALQYFISLRVSTLLYHRLVQSLLKARPRFFDITPVGRVMNRLSKDIETVDQEMTTSLRMMIESSVTLVAILGIICWATPSFLYLAVFIMAAYYAIGALYLGSSRDLKRIESVERSPLFTLLGETLTGTVTIRAYSDAERIIRRAFEVADRSNRAFWYLWCENRWLSTRVDIMGSIVTLTTSILLLLTGADAALAGFTLTYSVMIVQTVLRIVRRYTQTEINLNSVERIDEYITIESERQDGTPPPAHWPTDQGVIQVRDLSVRYAPEFPLALDGVSFDILPGEKVGIVGRTGSGKSTLSLAFFRFLEAERGSITIDGIDIASIPLESLRRQLTIIPQDSQLFRGTIRSNLDPFNVTDEADMWFALQRCQMAVPGDTPLVPGPNSVIKSLDDVVEPGGSNFSAGQRQLLSLARGLLKMRNSRILILDESTANLDSESDALIQRTIREQMAPGATILTVAHRLQTIIDYDKVLVLSHGKVTEFGAPSALLKDTSSAFYQLCERSGELESLKEAVQQM